MNNLLLFLVTLLSFSCSRTASQNNDLMPVSQNCFEERKVEEKITNIKGKVVSMLDAYFIQCGDATRYEPCDIPQDFRKDGLEVIISGKILELYDNERRAGRPIHLAGIGIPK